jgi:hypothetical protein
LSSFKNALAASRSSLSLRACMERYVEHPKQIGDLMSARVKSHFFPEKSTKTRGAGA